MCIRLVSILASCWEAGLVASSGPAFPRCLSSITIYFTMAHFLLLHLLLSLRVGFCSDFSSLAGPWGAPDPMLQGVVRLLPLLVLVVVDMIVEMMMAYGAPAAAAADNEGQMLGAGTVLYLWLAGFCSTGCGWPCPVQTCRTEGSPQITREISFLS